MSHIFHKSEIKYDIKFHHIFLIYPSTLLKVKGKGFALH